MAAKRALLVEKLSDKYVLYSEWLQEEHELEVPADHLQVALRHYNAFQRSDVNRAANKAAAEERAAEAAESAKAAKKTTKSSRKAAAEDEEDEDEEEAAPAPAKKAPAKRAGARGAKASF